MSRTFRRGCPETKAAFDHFFSRVEDAAVQLAYALDLCDPPPTPPPPRPALWQHDIPL